MHFLNNSLFLTVAGMATAMMRTMNIKQFVPPNRVREQAVCADPGALQSCRSPIFRENGHGLIPTIVVAGFVPDAPEVVEYQRHIFRSYGSIYYVNFARNCFDLELFHAQLADLITCLNAKGEQPVLFGVSFGAGLVVDFMRTHLCHDLKVGALALVSPVICMKDLVRPREERRGGVRMLESIICSILKARSSGKADIDRQIERTRRCFLNLFDAGARNRLLTSRHLSIRRKVMDVLRQTTANGAIERLQALQDFSRLNEVDRLFAGPVLALLAEAEDSILVPSSPTMATLRNPGCLNRVFPKGICREVSSANADDPVTHASLVFHHDCYNAVLSDWYGRYSAYFQGDVP